MASTACLCTACLCVACSCVASADVALISKGKVTVAESGPLSRLDMILLQRLANGDLESGQLDQHVAVFGREDLAAANKNAEYAANPCTLMEDAPDPLDAIVARAKSAQIVIINESHVRSRTRAFIGEIAQRLAPLGFTHYAGEAFAHRGGGEGSFLDRYRGNQAATFEDTDGFYSREAVFGRLIRTVQKAGYRLVPYEQVYDQNREKPEDRLDQIHLREEAQANNLITNIFADEPEAKVLIHVGYRHAAEHPIPWDDGQRSARWMAARLKEKTGIDPLTINQTSCIGNAATGAPQLAKSLESLPTDITVDQPIETFAHGRPVFRTVMGDKATEIPTELMPESGWHIIEARDVTLPDEAVPVDRVLIKAGEDVRLMLPPGTYNVRAVTP